MGGPSAATRQAPRSHGLLLEDPGGDPLPRLLGEPMKIGVFLPLAIGISRAVAGMRGGQ